MRVEVDTAACEGYGICALLSSAVFTLETDTVTVTSDVIPAAEYVNVHNAVNSCPVNALATQDE